MSTNYAEPTAEQYHAGAYVLLIAEHLATRELEGRRVHVTDRTEAEHVARAWFATHDEHACQVWHQHDRITRAEVAP